jgi:hypothetical protein
MQPLDDGIPPAPDTLERLAARKAAPLRCRFPRRFSNSEQQMSSWFVEAGK